MGACGSNIPDDNEYASIKSQYEQPTKFNNVSNHETKKHTHFNFNIRTYILLNHLIRNAKISVPSDIFLCLCKYCDETKYKSYKDVKIWMCSWNMSQIKDDISINELKHIIPVDYDLYVFGVQDAVTNVFFDRVTACLNQIHVGNNVRDYNTLQASLANKHTGIYVYFTNHLVEHISIHSKPTISESDGIISSNKGGACFILNVYSTQILLMSIDITQYNKLETLVTKCRNKVGEQYQHIIIFGTFNNKHIKSEIKPQIHKLSNGNALDIWKNDSLTQMLKSSKNNNSILKSFNEPNPMINFSPTYPKHKNRKNDFQYHGNKSQKLLLSEIHKVYEINNKQISFCDRILYASFDYVMQSLLIPQLNTLEYPVNDVSDNYNSISNYLMQSKHSPVYCGMILTNNIQNKQIKLTIHKHNGYYCPDCTDDWYPMYHLRNVSFDPNNLLDGSNNTYYRSKSETTSGDWIIFKMETNSRIKPTKISIINSQYNNGIKSISLFIGSNNNFFPLCPNILNIQKDSGNKEEQEWFIRDKLFVTDYVLSTNQLNLIKIKILNNYGSQSFNIFHSFDLFGVELE